MSDRRPAQHLIHTVKFRVSEQDHARLASLAEYSRVRINELARQLVLEKSRRTIRRAQLDPAIVIQLQDIGLLLRQMLADGSCNPDLRSRIADLCQKIEVLIDHAIAAEDGSWSR